MVLFASDVQRAPVIVVTPTVASQLFNFAEQPLSVQVSNNIITRAHNKLIQTLSWKLWNGVGGGGERLKPRTGQVTITSQDTKPTDLELPFNPVRMFLWEEIEVPK